VPLPSTLWHCFLTMNVYWLEQFEANVPRELKWLGERELVQVSGMRFAKRRSDWLLGRWTAKHAVAACLRLPADLRSLAEVDLRPATSGAPEVFLANQPAPVSISLSHRNGTAACAVAPSGGALGCDLEAVEPHSDVFVEDYFTDEERKLVARATSADRPLVLTLLWSAKESALKALRAGLRLDTRSVSVCPVFSPQSHDEGRQCNINRQTLSVQTPDSLSLWRRLHVSCADGQGFHGWWQHSDGLVRSMVSQPASLPPLLLRRRIQPNNE